MVVEIIILNYNGGALLLECLPSLMAAARKSGHDVRIVLLDNLSTDGSAEKAVHLHPEITLVHARENLILCSYNDYLKQSSCDIAVLLNNDIRVEEDFVDPLVTRFEEDPELFMVTPKCLSYDGSRYEGGITQFRIKYGIFWASSRYPGHEKDMNQVHPTMAAGYGAFQRRKFLELGGYDDLYLPGRLEDSDLCFRAWKRGWKLLYEPHSVVYHKGGVAFHKRFGESGTLRINHRNSFLFFWKNIRDPAFILAHFFFVPFRLIFALIRGQKEFVWGFFDALPLASKAIRRRASLEPSVISDHEAFSKV